mgnify:FL=1
MTQYLYHAGLMPTMTTPTHMYSVYDRTQSMIKQPQIKCISPIGTVTSKPKAIEELCSDSAQNVLNKAKGKIGRAHV